MSESGGTTEVAGGAGGLRLLPGAGRVGRLRLRTLVTIRWIALVGQALALLFVHFGLGFQVPLTPALLIVASYLAFNLAIFLIYPSAHRLDDRSAASQLALDVLQLALLLFLTGGLKNPFALLLLVPVTISATILSLVSTVGLALLVLALVTLLAFLHLPLPWGEPAIMLPDLYVAGTWTALVLGMGFVAIYAWQVAAEARRMADALAATQLVLAREQQLSALGGLAAAAAHELGTPLGTIVLVAKELLRELPPESPFVEDVRLLSSQADRCREILAQLSQRRPVEDQAAIARLPIGALVEEAMAPHRKPGIACEIEVLSAGAQPEVTRRPEILHGLGNLLQNAFDFARTRVTVSLSWTDQRLMLRVLDDGPGISVDILGALGEPYVTSRPDDGGMGLGVFIAKTLLEHTGASVRFANNPAGGCLVSVAWERARLDEEAHMPVHPDLRAGHV
ncbi:MAG: ActS/PrrB/RegB family redox-sensitive histidine kinase [Alphaproteobacteria bacterium]|nr:ActS/PrrB/RegB family redox-sensitive histidine kinase [Alphaproteobacteria bacterium]